MDDKVAIRKRMRLVRDMVDDRLMRSVQLWAAVAALEEYRSAATVMAFASFGTEPDTDPLFARARAEGKRMLVPRNEHGNIVVVAAEGPTVRSRIGVQEPQGPPLPFELVEFVIVPGLAFTPDGYRLGYGGGFYDRFLPQVRAPNAGVCFAELVVDTLPVEAHDVRVQRLVTA
jgi:5-formyltetrahydrofolate cyclo-ligase